MWEVSKPLINKWMIKEKFSPRAVVEKGKEYTDELAGVLKDLPLSAHRAVKKAAEDRLKVGFVHERLEPLSDGIISAGRRITTGLIVASLVVGASVVNVFSGADAARVLGVPVLSVAGFAIALALGLRLFLADLRRNSH
jgi:ubiquinone biosynthesis protein